MRKLIAVALVFAMASLGAPVVTLAQSVQLGAISGEFMDAGGRAIASQQVELVQDGVVLRTATTDSTGQWTFASVKPGEYIVRTTLNGRVTGVAVTLATGQSLATANIVAPSAAAPSAAFMLSAVPLWGMVAIAGVAAAVVTTAIVVTGS